jgi:hypothetical protein
VLAIPAAGSPDSSCSRRLDPSDPSSSRATSYCCRAFTIVERMARSCMMSSRCSYSQRRAKISSCCRSRVRVSSSRKAPDSARRCASLSQWKSSTSHASCWCSKRVLPRPYMARSEAKSGAATLNCSPRWRHKTAGTTRTTSRTRPLMRKKPICNANPSFRAGCREREERLDLEGRQLPRDLFQTEKYGLPWVHCTLLGWSAIASQKSGAASPCSIGKNPQSSL